MNLAKIKVFIHLQLVYTNDSDVSEHLSYLMVSLVFYRLGLWPCYWTVNVLCWCKREWLRLVISFRRVYWDHKFGKSLIIPFLIFIKNFQDNGHVNVPLSIKVPENDFDKYLGRTQWNGMGVKHRTCSAGLPAFQLRYGQNWHIKKLQEFTIYLEIDCTTKNCFTRKIWHFYDITFP